MTSWSETEVRALPLESFDERYRRYRLRVPEAGRAIRSSLVRYGQMSPVAVCVREGLVVLIDGFKRLEGAHALHAYLAVEGADDDAPASRPPRRLRADRLRAPSRPRIDYAAVRSRTSMAQVLTLLEFTPTRCCGHQLRGRCPLPDCRSRSPVSFSVHLQKQIYQCFASRSHGNHLDLCAAARHLPLAQAAPDLCRAAHITIPLLPPGA